MKNSIRYDGKVYDIIKVITVEVKGSTSEQFALVIDEETGNYCTWFACSSASGLQYYDSRRDAITDFNEKLSILIKII